jgi:hypothetical protein
MADEYEHDRAGTRWSRFILMFALGAVGSGVLVTGMSQGAIAASFTVSGTSYKISADELRGQGVVQYGAVDQAADQSYPVFVTGFGSVEADNFCQTFVVKGTPVLGDITVRIAAEGQRGFSADNLVIGIQELSGDLTLKNVELGHDAGQFDKGPAGVQGQPGSFGIQSDGLVIGQVRQSALSTTAATLRLNQVKITTANGQHECF